jgi:prepilin-type N-terminal cleavage/methylation domain-containing protein
MGRRSGFTLIETLLAVIIVSVMTLMAYPRVNRSITKANLRGARVQVANMLAAARITATSGNRNTALIFNGNAVRVEAQGRRKAGAGTLDTIGLITNLNTLYGVTATLSSGTQVQYNGRGLASNIATGSNIKISLTRNSYTDSVVVDMLGRVQK